MTRIHRSFAHTRWGQLVGAGAALGGTVAACSGTPEPLVDGAFVGSNTVNDAARPDAVPSGSGDAGSSAEASAGDPRNVTCGALSSADAGRGGDIAPPGDARAAGDGPADATGSGLDLDGAPFASDATPAVPTSCAVTFTVTGAVVDGLLFQQVLLGGDVAALGAGVAASALKMTQASHAAGTWSTSVVLADGQAVHFRFGMASTGATPLVTWETPDNARTIVVSCAAMRLSYVGTYGAGPDGG